MIPAPVAAFAARQGVQAAWRIAKIAVPILVVLGLVIALALTRSKLEARTAQRDGLQRWQNGVLVVVAQATRNRTVQPVTVFAHIAGLAANVETYRVAVAQQNAAIQRAAAAGEQRLEAARAADRAAIERNAARERTRRSLTAPGRTDGITAAEWSQL